jgi:alanyl-tRNA synthetase
MADWFTLPSKHVDTGMGFERLCMAIQGKQSNYDTDVFQGTIKLIADKAGKVYAKTSGQIFRFVLLLTTFVLSRLQLLMDNYLQTTRRVM